MMRSLFAAVSGLRNHQFSLSVIGNNLANINTIGFKNGRALFQEMLSETVRGASRPTDERAGTNPLQVGLGMSVAGVNTQFSQGQLQLTGNMMDMAIQGGGFFVLRNGDLRAYSRAGAFEFDGEGRLNAGQGLLVQGWLANAEGVIGSGSTLGDIRLPFDEKSPARATTTIRLASNLDASAEALNTITQSGSFLALAQATDSLTNLFSSSGTPIGVQDGDVVELRYAGTAETLVTNLSDSAGAPLDLQNGDTVVVTTGVGSGQFTFDDTMTLLDLGRAIENILITQEPGVSVGVNSDGSLSFSNPSGGGGNDLTVTVSAAGRSVFNSLIAALPVIDGTSTARSQATQVELRLESGVDFTNLNDLAAALQDGMRLGSSGALVTFQGGSFLYDNSAGSSDLVDVELTRSGATTTFAQAMGLEGVDLATGSTLQSETLLDTASESDNLADLYTAQGVSLGLQTGDAFTFDARLGGTPISPATLFVSNTGDGSNADRQIQTLGGLLQELEDILDLRTAGDASLQDGAIVIEGRSGLAQAISDIRVAEAGNSDLTQAMSFAETQAATDVTHEASIHVFDSLGERHLLSLVFTKDNDTPNRWTWQASVDGGQIISGDSGFVTFRGDGSLESFMTTSGGPLTFDPSSGANGPVVVDFDPGTPGGIDGITGFARPSTTAIVDQDGYTMGTLESVAVGDDGIIMGVFTNGTNRALAQIALASFNNPSGLQRRGGEGWISSANSGEPVIRRPGTSGDVGTISPGTLEMSNVDIAQEFTNMIVAQRGFQANARTITTSDEMLVELVNIKR
jgi:flagellar hook protein FlgE